jgi:hypothetical protein
MTNDPISIFLPTPSLGITSFAETVRNLQKSSFNSLSRDHKLRGFGRGLLEESLKRGGSGTSHIAYLSA